MLIFRTGVPSVVLSGVHGGLRYRPCYYSAVAFEHNAKFTYKPSRRIEKSKKLEYYRTYEKSIVVGFIDKMGLGSFLDMQQLPSCWTVLIGLSILLLWCWRKFTKNASRLPPGPPRAPLLGNVTQMRGDGMDRLRNVSRLIDQYGKNGITTFQFGPSKLIVFIKNYDIVKRILKEDAFASRPKSAVRDPFFQRQGIFFTDADYIKEHRRFALSTLRDFGMGKTWLQDTILDEAKDLVSDIKALGGKPVNASEIITPSVSNVICALSCGQRFDRKDERFRKLTGLVGESLRLTSKTPLIEHFPILRYIPYTKYYDLYQRWNAIHNELLEFMQGLLDQHKEKFRPEDDQFEPRDYIDAFLKEKHKRRNDPASTFTDRQLLLSTLDLFLAATDTTSATITWSLLYLLENPKVYARIRKDVDGVLGDRLYPTMADKDRLPYIQATISEAQRLCNAVPMPYRATSEDVELDGFMIPKGTMIAAMTPIIHEDPTYFPEPDMFKPERFLDSDGQLLSKVEGFFPFGIGKRVCVGEALARMELFLVFVTLIRNFDVQLQPGQNITSKECIMSIVNSPKPFNVMFLPRS